MLEALRAGSFDAVASWKLAEEIVEVLQRPRIRNLGIEETDVRDVLVLLAPFLPDVEIDIAIRKPDDTPVVAAAVSGAANAIVTGDKDLLDDEGVVSWLKERTVEVVTSAELLQRIG